VKGVIGCPSFVVPNSEVPYHDDLLPVGRAGAGRNSTGMATVSATASPLSVAVRIAGDESMMMMSTSRRTGRSLRLSNSSRSTFFAFKKIVGLNVDRIRQEFQTRTWLREEEADLRLVIHQQRMGGET
jgi:hypothetical protein